MNDLAEGIVGIVNLLEEFKKGSFLGEIIAQFDLKRLIN